MEFLTNTAWYTYVLIPLLIFIARVFDVSMGTVRVIFISKGFKFLAPAIGFFEVLIWLLAIQQIMNNLTNVFCYIAYAGGFATGTYAGIIIEARLSVGKVMIRIITSKKASLLFEALKKANHVVTNVDAYGPEGRANIVIAVIDRHHISKVIAIIKKFDRSAFYSVEDVRLACENGSRKQENWFKNKFSNILRFYKKAK